MLDAQALPLESQVAQLFMVGYAGLEPNAITRRFLKHGLGGVIFFRDNFEGLADARAVADQLAAIRQAVPASGPPPLLGIDQEGGQVERLPHYLFPTLLTPRAVACAPQPEALARGMYALMAQRLRQLGFNLNFFPTLDVNLNPQNPIIGVRSFGDDPQAVWKLAQIALEQFAQAGLIAVGKHFPGHGNGTVDSHLELPTLYFSEEELNPFQLAMDAGAPAMLVAHGYYPALQTTELEQSLPSSASPAVVQGLLRQRCGFDGVVITDDLCMGAITRHRDPVAAALASIEAGVDILLYKQSTDAEWAVYEAVLAAFREGRLPQAQLVQSVARILRLKNQIPPAPAFCADDFAPAAVQAEADAVARQGIGLISGQPDLLPVSADTPMLLVHPERDTLGNYAFDRPTSDDLAAVLQAHGFSRMESVTYPVPAPFSVEAVLKGVTGMPQRIVLVSFNPRLHPAQGDLYAALRKRYPGVPVVLVSAGMPDAPGFNPSPDVHLSLCAYRPTNMRALAEVLRSGLSG